MKEYLVKVIERHVGYVWVAAYSTEEAKDMALEHSECEYDALYDCEIVEEREI